MPIPGMPMPGGAGGPPPGPPPGFPGGTGQATAPQPMAGSGAQGLTLVKLAVEALQKALPALPMGTPLHTAVLKSVADIAKHMESAGAGPDPSAVMQQLVQMARTQQQQPQQAAMANMFPGAGGGGEPPPGPPGQ